MEKSKELEMILTQGAKKIISINNAGNDFEDFLMGRLLNVHNYEIENRDNNSYAFSTLWCMMYDIAIPLRRKDKNLVDQIKEGIHSQFSASGSEGYHKSLVYMFAAIMEQDQMGEGECKASFDTLLTLGNTIKECEVQRNKDWETEESETRTTSV